jgi:hypothetical protein
VALLQTQQLLGAIEEEAMASPNPLEAYQISEDEMNNINIF